MTPEQRAILLPLAKALAAAEWPPRMLSGVEYERAMTDGERGRGEYNSAAQRGTGPRAARQPAAGGRNYALLPAPPTAGHPVPNAPHRALWVGFRAQSSERSPSSCFSPIDGASSRSLMPNPPGCPLP